MDSVHLHLMLNHVPVIGTPFAAALLAVALVKRSQEMMRTALWFLVVVVAITIPAYITGENAEPSAKLFVGTSADALERHDQAAAIAFTGSIILGIMAGVGLLRSRGGKPVSTLLAQSVLVVALIVCGLMAWAANLGGKIRHPEVRKGENSIGAVIKPGS